MHGPLDSADVHPQSVVFFLSFRWLRVSCIGGFFWLLWCSLSLYLYLLFILLGIGTIVISFFLQWDDSIENLPQVRHPKKKKRRWTSLEEDTLRAGVKMYVFFQN
jgi:hypothetical protein